MKIAIITDTHFGARNDNQNFNDYFFKFYDDVFFPTLIEREIKTCIHMGDVMDRRKYVSYKTATDFRKRFIDRFIELDIDLHIIVGNHDTYYKNTNVFHLEADSLQTTCTDLAAKRHGAQHMNNIRNVLSCICHRTPCYS